jgi:SAM-dependent methyltransferase
MASPDKSTHENPPRPHSEDYFGGYRDFWWNPDFLALMATRLDLKQRRRVLDVGVGRGHWTRALAPHLAPGTVVTGVDKDVVWANGRYDWQVELGQNGISVAIRAGDACELPFDAASFDCVTCQTLLIHLARPRDALAEMLRVLAPGGLLLCVEPDNFATWSAKSSLSEADDVAAIAEAFRIALTQERGRIALGLGDASVGGRIPGLFAELGLVDIRVHLSDKAVPLYPPYGTPEQKATVDDTQKWYASAKDFSRDENLRLYLAGGGQAEAFDEHWQRELVNRERYLAALRERKFDCAGGVLMYLVSGTKREAPGGCFQAEPVD